MVDPISVDIPDFIQRVDSDELVDSLEFHPKNPPNLKINNDVQRSLGFNLVKAGRLWVPMAGSSDGYVKTVTGGSAYEHDLDDSWSAVAASDIMDFGTLCQRFYILTTVGSCYVQFAGTDSVYGGKYYISSLGSLIVDRVAQYMKVTKWTATSSGYVTAQY